MTSYDDSYDALEAAKTLKQKIHTFNQDIYNAVAAVVISSDLDFNAEELKEREIWLERMLDNMTFRMAQEAEASELKAEREMEEGCTPCHKSSESFLSARGE